MGEKDWRKSLAQSYQWAIAGAVGAVMAKMDLPGPTAFLQEPVAGIVLMMYVSFLLLLVIVLGACLDQLITQFVAPDGTSKD